MVADEAVESVLEKLPTPVVVVDKHGQIIFVNSATERLVGRERATLRGVRMCELLVQPEGPLCSATEQRASFCATLRSSLGERTIEALPNRIGAAESVWALTDITEQRGLREAFLSAEREYRRTESLAAVGAWDWDIAANRVWWSDELYQIFGVTRDTPLTLERFLAAVHPDDRAGIKARIARTLEENVPYTVDHRIVRPDGSVRTLHCEGRLLLDAAGKPSRLGGILQDITSRAEAERSLRDSEARWQSMFALASDALIISDASQRIARVNPRVNDLLGYAPTELLGKPVAGLAAPTEQHRIDWAHKLVHEQEGAVDLEEWQLQHKDGTLVAVEVGAAQLPGGQCIAILRELNKRRQAEERIRFQASLLDMVEQGVIAVDRESKVIFLNRHAQEMYKVSLSDIVGKPVGNIEEALAFKLSGALPRVLSGEYWEGEFESLNKVGHVSLIAVTAAPVKDNQGNVIGAVATCVDITERRKWEAESIRAQKYESISHLAGGIAHDFNNLLTAMLGHVTLARTYAKPGGLIHDNLVAAEQAFARARDLTRQLLTFAKGGAPVMKPGSLVSLLQETPPFTLAGSNVRAEVVVPDDLWAVQFDAGQMNQVLSNLLVNARQAMAAGGVIRVQAENVVLEEAAPQPLQPGRYVRIEVFDQGVGIRQADLDHIFEPYFTTKLEGAGLGLASSYSIVKRHGGHIDVASEEGHWTRVHVYLPAIEEKAAPPVTTPTPIRTRGAHERVTRGQGRLLLMDDDEPVRRVAASLLQRLGYRVDTARDGGEAIDLYQEAQAKNDPYALAILDLTVVGGLGAEATLARLEEIDPSVRAVVSSGYATNPVLVEHRKHGFIDWIAKPYDIQELSRVVADAIRKQ